MPDYIYTRVELYDEEEPSAPSHTGIKFCKECNNMLYPKEDKINKVLLYACRSCRYQEESPDNKCIYINNLIHVINELSQIERDMVGDPTLPRSSEYSCGKCGQLDAVFIQTHGPSYETSVRPFYVCSNTRCSHRWIVTREVIEKPKPKAKEADGSGESFPETSETDLTRNQWD